MALAMLLAAGALAAPHAYHVIDISQADRPAYELTFPKPLRKGAVYAGSAHDAYTDRDIRVRFRLTRSGRIVNFRGPAADTTQPQFPIRATFYYAWYPDQWWAGTFFPYSFFRPTLGYYSDADAAIVQAHTRALLYAHLNAGIYSWWGFNGDPPTDLRFWRYLAAARTTPLRWALYYEREGYGDPSVAEIRADLERIRDTYASQPAYLKVGGRFVVYVYGDPHDNCSTAARWHEANTVGAYIVLKAFSGFRDCADQPDAWHEYSSALPEYGLLPDSFMVAPGFDERGEPTPRLLRDVSRWRANVQDMLASNAEWQLVLTFNEWREGTSVESAREWATPSGYGAYLDVLHELLP